MARNGPPAILELRELTHFCAMFFAGLICAMAVAERSCGPRQEDRDLIGQGSSRESSQENRRIKSFSEPTEAKWHARLSI